jgi:hypothetical protein
MTRETVFLETSAIRAMSLMVSRPRTRSSGAEAAESDAESSGSDLEVFLTLTKSSQWTTKDAG